MPDNRVCITLHFLMHGIHHYLPMDKLRLVMPPLLTMPLTDKPPLKTVSMPLFSTMLPLAVP